MAGGRGVVDYLAEVRFGWIKQKAGYHHPSPASPASRTADHLTSGPRNIYKLQLRSLIKSAQTCHHSNRTVPKTHSADKEKRGTRFGEINASMSKTFVFVRHETNTLFGITRSCCFKVWSFELKGCLMENFIKNVKYLIHTGFTDRCFYFKMLKVHAILFHGFVAFYKRGIQTDTIESSLCFPGIC